MNDGRRALVLGATGGIGGAAAARLLEAGWAVRALHRDPASARRRAPLAGVEWLAGDALRPDDVTRAAGGTALIVHAVNPPGYRDWARLVLPMLDGSLAAARASGARILLPGNVYNYGPDVFAAPIAEDAPQRPVTRKGALRVEMERRLRAAADQGVASLVVRAGDFFGPGAANSWFSLAVVAPGRPLRRVVQPGRAGAGHQWAYLPDVAETMVRLAERSAALPRCAAFHMAGHWDPDGGALVAAVRRAAGRAGLPVRRFPWPLLGLAAPVVPLFRELREMRYLWQQPVRLDNARLVKFLGTEPHTPLDTAVRRTLAGMGCIEPIAA